MQLSAISLAITRIGSGSGTSAPSFVLPANQTIFTVSAANTITASRDAEIYADGVSIGSASPSLSWTPASVDRDVTLEAVDVVSSDPIKVAVCEANAITTALTGWTQTNVATVGSQDDYSGGTSAYKVTASAGTAQHYITKTPSPVMTNAKTGFEITVKAGTNSKIILYFPWSSGNRKAIYDITSKQSFCELAYVKEVQDMGNGYKRLWCGIADSRVATGFRLYHTNTFDPLNSNTTTMAGTETFFALNPRITDGPLPLTNYQKCGFWESGTTGFGAKRWTITTEFNTSVTQMGQAMYIDVLLPDSYSIATQYRVVYLMPVEAANGTTQNNELEEVAALGLHNSMNCIFVRPYFQAGGNRTWGGVKNDGTINHDAYISEMLPGFMAEFYSVIDTREGRTIFGYSAGGFAAMAQSQRRPDVWGYCCSWDVPWTEAYAAYDQAQHFGTEAQYNLFHPYQNFASLKAAFTDKARLIVGGSFNFADDTASMYSRLVTELGNPLNNGGGDYATTITDTDGKWWKLNKTESAHDFITGWVTPAMSALQTLWSR